MTKGYKVYKGLGGKTDVSAVFYIDKNITRTRLENKYSHSGGRFVGFALRSKIDGRWNYFCEDGKWHFPNADMPQKKYFSDEDIEIANLFHKNNDVIICEPKWIDENGEILDCGYRMYRNKLMAHAFGGMDGNTYHNTLEAYKHGIESGYKYFEMDISQTVDDRLVLSHGWSKNACKLTGVTYDKKFKSMTYEMTKNIRVHGNPIIDVRDFYTLMKDDSGYTYEIDLHSKSSKDTKKLINSLIEDIKNDRELIDRLLMQVYNKKMYIAMNEAYPFLNYQYLVGKNIHKLDEILDFCIEEGICAVALRAHNIKKADVQKIRSAGIYTLAYTVNSDISYAKHLLDIGIDTICTDFITNDKLLNSVDQSKNTVKINYNSGLGECDYLPEYAQSKIKISDSGNLEYMSDEIYKRNDGAKLSPCRFVCGERNFVGWKLRVKVNDYWVWYCSDGYLRKNKELQDCENASPYIFSDEEYLPPIEEPFNSKVVLVAEWEEVD